MISKLPVLQALFECAVTSVPQTKHFDYIFPRVAGML